MVLVPLVQSTEVSIMKKKKEPSLFLRDNQVPTFYGIGIFEWLAVLSVLALILSSILKKF